MPATSLVKFSNRLQSNGKPLHWGRADLDGLPYRGDPLLVKEEEYEDRVVRVGDPHNGFFDVSIPEENKRYLAIMDGAVNGWFQIICLERFVGNSNRHYIEWIEYYMEDGVTRTPFVTPAVVELARGQARLPGFVGENSNGAQ